jgi:hypothetical protein
MWGSLLCQSAFASLASHIQHGRCETRRRTATAAAAVQAGERTTRNFDGNDDDDKITPRAVDGTEGLGGTGGDKSCYCVACNQMVCARGPATHHSGNSRSSAGPSRRRRRRAAWRSLFAVALKSQSSRRRSEPSADFGVVVAAGRSRGTWP